MARIMLSHYTKEPGLIGIVRSQGLWAREFSTLNDKVEFVYALPALCEEARSTILSIIPSDLHGEVNGSEAVRVAMSEGLDIFRKQLGGTDGYGSLYITSFAREGTISKTMKEY